MNKIWLQFGIFFIVVFTSGFFIIGRVGAVTPDHDFPRLANYYLNWTMTESTARNLSEWDVVVLDMEIQHRSPELLEQMRRWNPDIVLLVYITPQEIRQDANTSFSVMRRRLASGIDNSWYLKNSKGSKLTWWPGTYLLNVSNRAPIQGGKRLNEYIASFVHRELLQSGLWDGVFYDNSWDNITYFAGNDVDYDLDGQIDRDLDSEWQEGMKMIYNETRRLAGDNIILLGNSDNGEYTKELNGKMLENFSSEKWNYYMDRSDFLTKEHRDPSLVIVNANSKNTGIQDNYQQMRFGLMSSLLEDVYYSYDSGDQNHGQTWWYDEYNVNLGGSIGEATSQKGLQSYGEDVWRRDFEHGISVVNSSNVSRHIELGGEYEKIRGTQDPLVNDGSIISEVDIAGEDGLLLLKTFESIKDVLFTNGSFVRFLRPDGERVRNGFFVFEEDKKGNDQIAHIDLDGNGKRDVVVVSGNKLRAWRDDGQPYMKKYPYTASYKGGLRVAIGDLNGDKKMEIYVAPEEGYPAPIKIYTRHGRQMKRDWYPFGEGYTGGYSIAVGSVNTIKGNELIIGAGSGVRPEVHIFNQFYTHVAEWLAFESQFRGGVNVAAGDVDGDGVDEIIVGAGPGKKPVIRIFNAAGELEYNEFRAYSSFGTPGIEVRTADVDFDGKDDIIGMSSGIGL